MLLTFKNFLSSVYFEVYKLKSLNCGSVRVLRNTTNNAWVECPFASRWNSAADVRLSDLSCQPFSSVISCKSCRTCNEKLERVWMSFTTELSGLDIPGMSLCRLLNCTVTCGSNSRHMHFQRHTADDASKLEGELTVMPVCVCNDTQTIVSQLSLIPFYI